MNQPAPLTPPRPAVPWTQLAELLGGRLLSHNETQATLRFQDERTERMERTYLLVDNGGELCIYEVKLEAVTTDLPYNQPHRPGTMVGPVTLASRIGAILFNGSVDMSADYDT